MKKNRKWSRVYFSSKDAVVCELLLEGNQLTLARILNISEGGLAISLEHSDDFSLKKGDRLLIKSLKGLDKAVFTAPAVIEVVWVTSYENFSSMGMGCAFLYIIPPDKSRLKGFIEEFE